LSQDTRKNIVDKIVAGFAKKAYRTLLVAYTDMTIAEFKKLQSDNNNFQTEKDREVITNNLTMVAIFALQDPLRPEIKESTIACHRAGINIRMVTGDNLDTAKAIAIEAGILTQSDLSNEFACMTGKDFREQCCGLKKLEDTTDRGLLIEHVGNMN
jgi:P-type E1-E2 ATPase